MCTAVSAPWPAAPRSTRGRIWMDGRARKHAREGQAAGEPSHDHDAFERFWVEEGAAPTRKELMKRHKEVLEDIRAVDRVMQPPDKGIMCEMLWSDPQPQPGRSMSKRGVGCQFGPDVTARFLADNGLELLIRSHEVKDAGYEVEAGGKLVTVFSAPNYCDQMGNKGALLRFTADGEYTVHQFSAVAHPPVRPMAYAGMGGMFGF